ncbi:PH domain-containing protein [Phytoactinopolyspora halotolerans]|uniref:PH domain-containing protein n=1 Tax=Phytoactinopolyspora halotolerans TaxID=1981512 RepID=A0A6L9S2S8_9ACTN|nr:PH domain-containing protein [Phytoactinopolyspora halotolerans]NED98841.1 PH domain-containing protein [Phytoactinopolyspora halotolerans]
MDQLFAPSGDQWQQVSPKLITVRYISLAITLGVVVPVLAVGLWFLWGGWSIVVAAAVGLVGAGWGVWLIPRIWRAWGYAERQDDLLVTHGVMFRKLTVVPYGRMQFVDVDSGPLDRKFGLATVQLHTASPATDAKIPGLPADEAARLRDRLSALGEAKAAGL